MRISDWSSDVCSSDLRSLAQGAPRQAPDGQRRAARSDRSEAQARLRVPPRHRRSDLLPLVDDGDEPPPRFPLAGRDAARLPRSEEHTSELQSLMRTSYAGLCLKHKNHTKNNTLILR